MKIQMTKPPLRGHIIGNTIFLQTADWRNVCQYDYIKFYANARSLIVMPEDGKIVLLDYKTDRIDSPAELIKRYKAQIDLYAKAIEKWSHLKVKEKLLYSFCLKDVVIVE